MSNYPAKSQSVSGHLFVGSTGHWPVPPGDPPGGTGSTPGDRKDAPCERSRQAIPVGGSPTRTGEAPGPPIFRIPSPAPFVHPSNPPPPRCPTSTPPPPPPP